ncbi:RING finger ubiquitin ligase-like protein [Lizonia empirigonia]|nr:RING finger ubiquitin ligase-like protein [Lizonia empirigonia]
MEVRRDPRSFLFFIILLLLINSPEPQQPSFNTRTRYDELIQREWDQLDVLNRTRWGDFNVGRRKWLNVSGLRSEDGFAWEMLPGVKEKANAHGERALGDKWERVLDGTLHDVGEEARLPVYRNLSGYVQGEWVRHPSSRVRHPSDMGNTTHPAKDPFTNSAMDFDRNLTGKAGPVRVHMTELEDKMRTDANKTMSEISAKIVVGDDESFGGNWWEFYVHGVHFKESGHAVLTTTSERFAGIFALSHFQLSSALYDTSKDFLNSTIHETIDRQLHQPFPVWNPWTSTAAGSNEDMIGVAHHCEFVLYLQEPPSVQTMDMDWLEHEMRFPTGAPLGRRSQLSMSMVGFSPDCGYVIESKGPPDYPPSEAMHLVGSKTEEYNGRARRSIVIFAVAFALQLSFLIKQMKETATPSMRSRVSFYTIAMMALGDGFTFLVLIFMYLFLGTAQLAMYSIAFVALFSVLAHLRFLMDIWSVQAAERARQERQAAPATAPTATPTPPSAASTPAAVPAPPPQDDPLSDDDAPLLPTTNPAANTATPAATAPNPRAEFGALYSRFCLLLIVTFFVTIQFATARTLYRSVYFSILSFLYLSFWVPQIYRNVMRNCGRALRWDYTAITSLTRLIPIGYFYLVSDNVLFASTDWPTFAVLAAWVWIQLAALASQTMLGPRFFIRDGWAPPAYDYHPILRDDAEGALLPLNATSTDESSAAEGSSRTPAEAKDKRKKVFDCSICAMHMEVPVVPAGAADETAGVSGAAWVLQRRAYMVTPCRHVFHAGCLEGWMRYRLICPNCREALPPL